MSRFASTTIVRPVSTGQIFCLVQGHRVRVERCRTCDMLEGVVTNDSDWPISIRCRPPLAALLSPKEHRASLNPDWDW